MNQNEVGEIKQQAIIEKAQDPNSSVTAQAANEAIVEESKKAGVAAYQFNPNATREEKAAQLNSHIDTDLKSHLKPHTGTGIASDADRGPPQYDLPSPTAAGALSKEDAKHVEAQENPDHEDPDEKFWKIVGWAPRFGDGVPEDVDMTTNLLDHSTWVEERLGDKFFGDWYYNAGVIIFASLTSWVIAVLGGGLGWVFMVMAASGTYYRTSLRRVRRNARDDIRRELSKARLETDTESLEWINSFLVKFWPIYAPVLCKTIVMSVDQVLSVATPPMVESLKMKTFTLGTKPPRLEHVKTYPKADDDIVIMDWKFSFNPNDTADMTSRQVKVKQNPKVVLEVRVGRGVVSKGLDIIVEDMACEGIMRVKVKLQLAFPHIDRVEICFLEKPTMDYVCKPLGGDTFGFDINFIPGLEHFIMEQIHANLAPMMYAPNVFPIEIAKMLAGTPIDQAVGVVQITFHNAKGLRNTETFGTCDPYALVKVNDREELARTKTIKETQNPRWNETVNVIITSLKDTLNLHVYDWNGIRKDKELGSAVFQLERLEELGEIENETLELTYNGKTHGNITCDFRFFPVLGETKLDDGTLEPPPETLTGIIRYTVEQAKDLDGTKSLIGLLNPYAVLLINGKEVHISEKLKRTNNPIWSNSHKEILITDRKSAKIGLVIKDDRDLAADPIIGSYQIKLEDMLDLSAKGQEWYNLSGVKTGRAKLSVQWRPVDVKGALGGSGGYMTPIGVMRVHCKNARDLRNVETLGKSDPYVRALLSGVQKARTVTWKNNLNPDFDEVLYIPVHTPREKLTIEVMDEENMGKDRSLGHLEIPIQDYIHRNAETGEYDVHDTKQAIAQTLQFGPGKTPKGTLNYTCSFFPTIATVDPEEEEREQAEKNTALTNGNGNDNGNSEKGRVSTDTMKTAETSGRASGRPSVENVRKSSDKLATRVRSNTSTSSRTATTVDASKISLPEPPKIKITADNLIEYESGLLIFTLLDGEFTKTDCHLELVMDDHAFPSYYTNKIKTRKHDFNETGDAMVRELDQSQMTLRLTQQTNQEGKGSEKHIIAKLAGPTLQTLQRCLYTATPLTLRDEHGHETKVTVKLRFIPIKMKLDPSESFRNMGNLRVDVLEATNVPVADRNGYSDPYAKFYLNDKEVHKTDTKTKTLNPVWNETFEAAIRSRTAGKFIVKVYDRDIGSSDDFLGEGVIDLNDIEPYQRKEVQVPLNGESGVVKLRLLFTPDWIARSRQGSSTFHGSFSTAGKVAGAPIKGVSKAGSTVGGGVIKAGSFLGKSFRRRKSRAGSEMDDEDGNGTPGTQTPPIPQGPLVDGELPSTPQHQRNVSATPSRLSVANLSPNGAASADHGFANIAVVSAHGFPPSTNVRVHVRADGGGKSGKEIIKTKAHKNPASGDVKFEGETARHQCAADTPFKVVVRDHSTFGSDDDLGEGTFFVADSAGGAGAEQTVRITTPSGEEARVIVRSSFEPAGEKGTGRLSKIGWKREKELRGERERSVTPSA